jgi:hypothetical protein
MKRNYKIPCACTASVLHSENITKWGMDKVNLELLFVIEKGTL